MKFDELFKFRAWDPKYKVMTQSTGAHQVLFGGANDDIGIGLSLHWSIKNWDRQFPSADRDFNDCIYMIWTGLQDSYGADIYDGDIVEESELYGHVNIGVVKMESITNWSYGGYGTIYAALAWIGSKFRVIGNIYQHPELMPK